MALLSRRGFLKGAAAALAVATAGGLIRAIDQGGFSTGEGAAYEPWHDWMEEEEGADPLFKLIKASILAASAHNTQPWLYRIRGQEIDVFADVSRNIGTMDPYYREMHISLGCAIENLIIAAHANGYEPELKLYPGGLDRIQMATISLAQGKAAPSELFHAIGSRHTNRSAYDTAKSVDDMVLRQLEQLSMDLPDIKLVWFADSHRKEEMGNIIVRATEAIIADKRQAGDSHKWYRHDWDELQLRKDGTSMDATGNSGLTRFFGKMLPISEKTSNEYWLKMTKEQHVPTASAFGTLLVHNQTDRIQLLQAGMAWQRMHLWAAKNGLAMQPLNQPHERRDRELQLGLKPEIGQALENLIQAPGYEGVFTFRIGYPLSEALASPRRPAEEVVLAGSQQTV